MAENINSLRFIPEKLQEQDLQVKVSEMLDHIINKALIELQDVKYKYRGPDIVRDEVIKEVINEAGFEYITSVMETISNFQFNTLLEYVSLINLLKGSRPGIELVLQLLGFSTVITEWWEETPKAEPQTYSLTVVMNTTYVKDPVATLNKVRVFARHYVFPLISKIDYRFTLTFAEKQLALAGFWNTRHDGNFTARL